jgi:hypothetical protein
MTFALAVSWNFQINMFGIEALAAMIAAGFAGRSIGKMAMLANKLLIDGNWL